MYSRGLWEIGIYNLQKISVGRPKASELKKFPQRPIAWAKIIPKTDKSKNFKIGNFLNLATVIPTKNPNSNPPCIDNPPWRKSKISDKWFE